MRKILILFTALFVSNIYSQDILPLKERAELINKIQKEFGQTMKENGYEF